MLIPVRLKGVYSSFRPRLRITETGKSSPRAHAPLSAELNVSLGGLVGVAKNTRCFWNDVQPCRDMVRNCEDCLVM